MKEKLLARGTCCVQNFNVFNDAYLKSRRKRDVWQTDEIEIMI